MKSMYERLSTEERGVIMAMKADDSSARAIARVLAAGPKLLVLDEPTEGIQPSIIKDIGRVIRMLADRGDMAILLVEQYYDFAQELADEYVVMERGAVIAAGQGKAMEADGVRKLVAI